MRHENQPFVFVPDGERKFRRVDVELGLETHETIEVASGLAAGDTVVDRGAFFLKSELLLEREE
jgi:cobalt-zinc-cadmium efflux system membrane fusion protein